MHHLRWVQSANVVPLHYTLQNETILSAPNSSCGYPHNHFHMSVRDSGQRNLTVEAMSMAPHTANNGTVVYEFPCTAGPTRPLRRCRPGRAPDAGGPCSTLPESGSAGRPRRQGRGCRSSRAAAATAAAAAAARRPCSGLFMTTARRPANGEPRAESRSLKTPDRQPRPEPRPDRSRDRRPEWRRRQTGQPGRDGGATMTAAQMSCRN